MATEKRAGSTSLGSAALVKRQKSDSNLNGGSRDGALIRSGQRASGLDAPVMELTGHTGEIFAARFDPNGRIIASGSMDRSIMLWRSYGQCENFGVLNGHKGAILDVHWSRDARVIFSASADAMLSSWDTETGERIRRHPGHDDVINCMDVSQRGEEILVSGSDDSTIGLWDPRQKESVDYIETDFPVTAIALSEAGNELYTGSIDNEIKVWDLRKRGVAYVLQGHTDTITSLQISSDSQSLLSNSHDSTVRTWDIRPFAPADRQLKTFEGSQSGMEKNLYKASWDASGKRIAAGGGDRAVVVWESRTEKLLHKLPGHRGAVNDVRFSPSDDTLMLSASSDRTLLLGELSQ